MRALITGGTGFIGRALAAKLVNPVILSRNADHAKALVPDAECYHWNPLAGPPDPEAFRGVDLVFNLMGDPIAAGRWNPRKRAAIRDSRITGTRNLVTAIAGLAKKPKVIVSASAIGFYGSRGDEVLDETSASGADFLADTCREWEAETMRATESGVRAVCVRNGIVLRKEGGALKQMLPPFRLGLGGRLGDGKQWMSWIHLDDLLTIYLLVAERSEVRGPVNGVAPHPVTNREFTRILAGVLHRPAIFPVPKLAIRIAFGGVAEVMLGSQRVLPRTALGFGMKFAFPDLTTCLRAAL